MTRLSMVVVLVLCHGALSAQTRPVVYHLGLRTFVRACKLTPQTAWVR